MKTCVVCGKSFDDTSNCCSPKCGEIHLQHFKTMLRKAVKNDKGHTKNLSVTWSYLVNYFFIMFSFYLSAPRLFCMTVWTQSLAICDWIIGSVFINVIKINHIKLVSAHVAAVSLFYEDDFLGCLWEIFSFQFAVFVFASFAQLFSYSYASLNCLFRIKISCLCPLFYNVK